MIKSFSILAALFFSISLYSGTVWAQPEILPEKKPKEVKKKDGWGFLLTPGASLSLADNRSVIGQQEGLTVVLGASLASGANFREGAHEWRSTLNITETFTQTPTLDEFVKSTDIFKFESIYLYHALDWLGPFAKVNVDTTLLEGFDNRPEVVTWSISRLDGTVEERSGFNLRLTDGFSPLNLKETAGVFAKPHESDELNLEARLGFGGLHVFTDGLTVKDDDATPEIEVVQLDGFSQAGGVLELAAWGEFYEKKVTYKLTAEFMMPFINDLAEGDDRSAVDLTNMEFTASLSFKLLEWLSIDYVFRAIKQPQLLDEFQIQNNLLLTASYAFFKPPAKK
jgi:hypothetical protein